jgi:hypothetical protein
MRLLLPELAQDLLRGEVEGDLGRGPAFVDPGGWFCHRLSAAEGGDAHEVLQRRGIVCRARSDHGWLRDDHGHHTPHRGQPRHDCKPRINNVGLGADDVGRRPWLESLIVGQNRAIIASPAFN